jgi:uncharacterized protein (DUF433 family)
MAEQERSRGGPAHVAGPLSVEAVAERAERLGITVERVLQEYRNIAFADLRRIIEWDDKGMKFRAEPPDDMVAIIEIVASAGTGRPYRIKMHDKKPVLDALGRAIGVFPKSVPAPIEEQPTESDAQSARERLIAECDRVAAERGEAPSASEPGR